jgi:hypothetical protein
MWAVPNSTELVVVLRWERWLWHPCPSLGLPRRRFLEPGFFLCFLRWEQVESSRRPSNSAEEARRRECCIPLFPGVFLLR